MCFKSHVIIDLNSKDRETNSTLENPIFRLSHQITFSQNPIKSYFMRLENTLIPKTFYDIDSNNNVFQIIEDDGVTQTTITITIDEGNYTITELLTELETQLDTNTVEANDYTLSYDTITNKITISCVFGTATSVIIDTIANGSTLNNPLGFSRSSPTLIDSQITLSTGVDEIASYSVDLDSKSYIMIESNITSKNCYDKNSQKHLGGIIPVNVDRNEKIFFGNADGYKILINGKQPLSSLQLKLKDENGNSLDLNGTDWSTTLCIYELTELHKTI